MRGKNKKKAQVGDLEEMRQRISELEASTQQLRKANETFRNNIAFFQILGKYTRDIIFILDEQGTIEYLNEYGADFFGVMSAEITGKNMTELFPPEAKGIKTLSLQELVESGEPAIVNDSFSLRGRDVRMSMRLVPVRNEAGKLSAVLGVAHDANESRETEDIVKDTLQRIKEEIARPDAIIESIGDPICILDPGFKVLYENRIHRDLYGDHEGDYCYSAYQKRKSVCPGCQMTLAFQDGKVHTKERSAPTDKGTMYVAITASPLKNSQGEIVAGIEVVRDITRRKEMEEALRESEAKFRSLAEHSLVGVYLIQDGLFRYVNPKVAEIHGYRVEELIDRMGPRDLVFPEDRALLEENIRKRISGEVKSIRYRMRGVRKNKEVILLEVYGSGILYQGRPAIIGTILDVTDRVKYEQALQESEEKYRLLVETANEGIVVAQWDMLKFVNPKFLEMTGYTREELISEPFTEIIYPDDRDFVLQRRLKRLRGELGPVDTYCFRITRKDGQVRWLEVRSALGAWEGSPATVNFLRDITKRRKVEESLRESEARFRNIFDSTPVAIWEEDYSAVKEAIDRLKTEGVEDFRAYLDEHPGFVSEASKMARILDMNDATLRLYGAGSKEELVGALDRIFTPDSYSAVRGFLIAIFEGKRYFEAETVNKTLQGEVIDIFVSIAIPSEESEFRNLLVCIMDLTEHRKLEKELLKSQKLESLGILAGGIAHDFNNILTAILGNISLAAAYAEPGDKISERLLEAEKATLRAKDLSQQLLTFSKGGAPVKKAVSLEEIIKDSSGFALRGSRVRAVVNLADGLWPVEADEGQIGQGVNNIVINAVHAMPEGGVIRISAENVILGEDSGIPVDQGDYVKVTFSDQGIGIPAEFLPKIFDPYFTTKQKGSGLGLAVTYSIIKNHGGHISVESELGKGTTFFVYLPASRTSVVEKTYEKDIPVSGKERVLIMDDEDMLREVAGMMLEELGYEVDFARDGEEAIQCYKKALESFHPFDAVIMDLTVPGGKGGKETIKELLKIAPEVKAIVSSGYSHDPVMSNFKEYGFSDVISKPYKSSELVKVLRRVLEGS